MSAREDRLGLGHSRLITLLAVLFILCKAPCFCAQTNEDCLACHSGRTLVKQTKAGKVSLYVRESALKGTPHGQLECVSCHTGLDTSKIPHASKIEPVNCLACHDGVRSQHRNHKDLVPAGGSVSQQIAACKGCHGSHMSRPLSESCGGCHKEEQDRFAHSAHGKALRGQVDGAPTCFTCHKNDVVNGRDQARLKIAQEKMCLSCHADNPKVAKRTVPRAGFMASYETSVHGAALAKGNASAANCVDCHGSHEMLKGVDPAAHVSHAKISETCGKCHPDAAKEYAQSIHGVMASKGSVEAPVCTSCHGEHNILRPSDPKSPVAHRNLASQVCGSCHSSVRLSEKYGIRGDRFQTFSDSYHGLAIRGGDVRAANCASCHGSHNVRPSSDPASMVNKANIPKTCGKCHPGANKRFAIGKVHVAMTVRQQPVLFVIGTAYLLLIVCVVGGMLGHNLLDLFKKWRRHVEEHDLHGSYVRMSLSERVQHLLLMTSFICLVITGFMLHYPDAWWVAGIRAISDHIFSLRSILHRIAAVVMVSAGVYHVAYVRFTPRGRQLIRDLLPSRQDFFDAIRAVRYGLGLTKDKPVLGRFSYIEKSEYWALVWGSVVMTVTGVTMWMENASMGLLTKLGWDIARTIHFYEAWLAALAIVVWHLYFVIFNPTVYPMNAAWLTGTLPEDVLAEEHPQEYEKLRDKIAARKRKTKG